jgi:hypothetical protein
MQTNFEATLNIVNSLVNLDYKPNQRKMELIIFDSHGYKGVFEIPELPCIIFSKEAIDKARYLAWRSKTMVGWNWIGQTTCNNDILVRDLKIFPQIVTEYSFCSLVHEDQQSSIASNTVKGDLEVLGLGHTCVDTIAYPSFLDEQMLWKNDIGTGEPLDGQEDRWIWSVVVNRRGDFQLMITNETLLYNHYVIYAPWQLDKHDSQDWDFSELEKALVYVQDWKAYNGTTRIVEAAKLEAMKVEPLLVKKPENPNKIMSEQTPTPRVRIRLGRDQKVTFGPHWEQQYDPFISSQPLSDPDWVYVKGFGNLTREQAFKGTIVVFPGSVRKLILEDDSEILLDSIPSTWISCMWDF